MSSFEITPYHSIGPLRLGADRSAVRSLFPGEVVATEFIANYEQLGFDVNASDYFVEVGLKAEYEPAGGCCFAELDARNEILFRDVSLFAKSYRNLAEWFFELGAEIREDDAGFAVLEYGIAIYAPGHEENQTEAAELISVFQRGYFDD